MWLFLWDSEPSKIFVGDTSISKVFLWDTQVRPSYTPWPWQPDPTRTMLYLKFNNNLADSSGNWVVVSWAWISYWTIGDNHYAEMTGGWSQTYITPPVSVWNQIWMGDFCVSLRWYPVTTTRWSSCFFMAWNQGWWAPRPWIFINYGADDGYPAMRFHTDEWKFTSNMPANQWIHMCFTRVSWEVSWYINWQLLWSFISNRNISGIDNFFILNRNTDSYQQRSQMWAKVSEVILEKAGRSNDDVSNYYDQTKSNYWL